MLKLRQQRKNAGRLGSGVEKKKDGNYLITLN